MSYYKPKIGYVVKRYPRYSETFIVNEILAHERVGYDVVVFSLRPPNDTNFQNIISEVKAPVYYIPYEGVKINNLWDEIQSVKNISNNFFDRFYGLSHATGIDVYQGLCLFKLINKLGIDHLHAHFASVSTTVTRIASLLSDIPYSFTAHAKDIYHDEVDTDDFYSKIMNAQDVITISDYNLLYLKQKYQINTNKIQLIYNGIDLKKFTYKTPLDRKPLLVSAGRLVEKKGFNILIEACAILKKSNVIFKCEIVGTGVLENDLNLLIKKKNLEHLVCLVGPLPQNEIIDRISSASIFIAPCIIGSDGNRDGIPTVLLESMALGTPCISTDVTGIPEILHHNATGLMVKQNNPKQLAEAIKKLLCNDPLKKTLSVNARKLIDSNFDIEKNTVVLREIFTSKNSKLKKVVGESD